MFIVWFIATIIFIGGSTLTAIVLFIVSNVIKKKQSAEGARKTKAPKVTKILAWVCMVPLIGSVLLVFAAYVGAWIDGKTSLPKNVESYNFEQAEKILKKGTTPDCTTFDNSTPAPGVETLLFSLCARLADEETEKRLQMAELLLEYGADIEYRPYNHPQSSELHIDDGEPSAIYMPSDHCGETPLLAAVRYGNFETVKFLVEHGADVNARDYCGFNAVNVAADNLEDEDGLEIVKYLIEQGADAKNITNYGQSSVWLAERKRSGTNPFENDEILALLEKESGIAVR